MTKFTRTAATTARQELLSADVFGWLQQRVEQRLRKFHAEPLTPLSAFALEKDLKGIFDATACEVLEQTYNGLEPGDKEQTPPRVRYRKETYRINKRTKAQIATCFGSITLWSFLYLSEEDGEPGLHPLHAQLGIVAGATTALAERVSRWAVDHSQGAVRALLQNEHGLKWSNDRLRHVLREFHRRVEAFRAEVQVERLLNWLEQAQQSRGWHRPVLAVGRDGVMVPIRKQGYQEASAATVSVYDRSRRRLGTVYLGQMPESQQTTMTRELTSLLRATLTHWSGPTPRLVYVTDKGQAPEDYYRRVLRRLKHPRHPEQRLPWEWVLDYFHVSGYVGKLQHALFGDLGQRWFERMRRWLRDRPQGVAQILRSAMQHYQRRKLNKAAEQEFWKAYRYLRNHSRWMDYARYRRQGLPIGSGVTEAACKTVFTQRLKRSGMRWHKDSAQIIVDLRVICLSGIWDEVVNRELRSRTVPERLSRVSHRPCAKPSLKMAA